MLSYFCSKSAGRSRYGIRWKKMDFTTARPFPTGTVAPPKHAPANRSKRCGRGHGDDGLEAAIHVGLGRRPRRHADPHGGPALPQRAAAPTRALGLHPGDDAPRAIVGAERHEHLVGDHVVAHLE